MWQIRALAGYHSSPGKDKEVTLENTMNFSDIYHSDEEYFRKLKDLRAAHAEAMVKLEKMYQDKLTMKDIQAALVGDDSYSSASEKRRSHPALSATSLSEPDLDGSSSLSTTTDELPDLEKKTPGEIGTRSYAKELINNMWNDFSVEDYYTQYDSDLPTAKKSRKKPKAWTPRVTVPAPFEMTVREQKQREKASDARETREKALRRNEDAAECKKKFRANPVPSRLLLPLYEDLVKQSEERRKKTRERSKAALLASQKPFKFIAREEQKQAIRERKLRELLRARRKPKQFKARPVPRFIYRPPANVKPKREELYGDSRTQPKARNVLHSSPGPSHSAYRAFRDPRSPAMPRGKHRHRRLSPGEQRLEKWKEPSEHSFRNCPVLCDQCCLYESLCDPNKRQKILANVRMGEEILKELRRPNPSPRHKSPRRSAHANARPSEYSPPMPTASSRGREQAIRRSEKARMKEYWQELEEQDKKLQKRPLLFERVSQRNARLAAERSYSNTLKALGLSEEFVSQKGRSGKASENVTRREPRSCTSDKESSYGEKRENEEENYLTDTSSQDSYKGNKEDVKESGEENSGECA